MHRSVSSLIRVCKGIELYGKTLGVIGTGRIGLHSVRMAKGFGMQVVAFDVYENRGGGGGVGLSATGRWKTCLPRAMPSAFMSL